jgi:hypothetical protein
MELFHLGSRDYLLKRKLIGYVQGIRVRYIAIRPEGWSVIH